MLNVQNLQSLNYVVNVSRRLANVGLLIGQVWLANVELPNVCKRMNDTCRVLSTSTSSRPNDDLVSSYRRPREG